MVSKVQSVLGRLFLRHISNPLSQAVPLHTILRCLRCAVEAWTAHRRLCTLSALTQIEPWVTRAPWSLHRCTVVAPPTSFLHVASFPLIPQVLSRVLSGCRSTVRASPEIWSRHAQDHPISPIWDPAARWRSVAPLRAEERSKISEKGAFHWTPVERGAAEAFGPQLLWGEVWRRR